VTGSLATTAGGLLIAGSCFNDNVNNSSPTLTQSGATFGTVTERCDGGTGTGFTVSGSLHTIPVTTGATAALTFGATLSAASQGATYIIQQTETSYPPGDAISGLTANFDVGLPADWVINNTTGTPITVDAGTLRIRATGTAVDGLANPNPATYPNYFDLTGRSLIWQVVSASEALAGGGVYIYVEYAPPGGGALDRVFVYQSDGSWHAMTEAFVSLASVAHADGRWFRFREASGTLYWEWTDTPSGTWTTLYSQAVGTFRADRVMPYFNVTTGTDTVDVRIDNINLPPTGSTTDFFRMF
jgi:hypothetical protein